MQPVVQDNLRTTPKRRRAILRFSVGTIVVLLVVSMIVALAVPRLRRRASNRARHTWLLLTGQLVDVGGYRLRIQCQGTGTPTVILESGLAQPMLNWGRVPSDVAKFTRVCAYDRAGIGDSAEGVEPRTSQRMVEELHTLLSRTKIAGPYLLVGHSFGGLNVRLYASEFPSEVTGIVLLDASTEDQQSRYAALLPSPSKELFLRKEANNREKADIAASSEEVRAIASAPAVPTEVLTALFESPVDSAPNRVELEQAWYEMQSQLASRFPRGRHILVKNSHHFIQRDQPDVVVNAIREVLAAQ
jgi:pimeloyl-ACP methyl ester carboxylesterase